MKKRQKYTKDEFSDKQVYNEIKDQIKQIRDKNMNQVNQDLQISRIYEQKKKQMRIQKMQNNKDMKPRNRQKQRNHDLVEEDYQQGQIKKDLKQERQPEQQGAPTINDLGQHIKPITITRNIIAELFKSRKFEQTIKGCFVRYKSENSNTYVLALILGTIQGQKQYQLNNNKTKTLLRLQQSSTQIIKLNLDHVSNQHPPGGLEITKWLQDNRSKMPKQREFKQKLQQLNNVIHGKVSSLDIDKNLLFQAQKVANDKADGVYNLSQLIFFMKNQIHDLAVTLEQLQGNKDNHDKIVEKSREKKDCDQILNKLYAKQAQIRAQKIQNEKEQKKQKNKGYSSYIYNDRKQDKIRDVSQKRFQQLCSFQGSNKIRSELHQAHRAFDFDIEI